MKKSLSSVQSAVASSSLTKIVVSPVEHRTNDAAIAALVANDQTLFQRVGRLVDVIHDKSRDGIRRAVNAPRIRNVSSAGLRERLTRFVRFVTETSRDGSVEERVTHPPGWCVEAIAARGIWPGIRPLIGVVTAPVLRPDGSILNVAGYDPETGLLFDPQGTEFPMIANPTREDAIRAAESLNEVVGDFPFAKPEHRAGWLAFLLTALARFAFDGPAPLFLIDANIRGSGKSFLGDLVSLIVLGADMARMSNPRDDEEARKRITSLAIAGDSLVLIDNISHGLGCAALDAALTATVWKDRVLGKSDTIELPLNATWCATGNNVVLLGDTSRRVVHIRLDSPLENPEQREGFRHPDLRAFVKKNRPQLLTDALTILSAYCQADRPQQRLPAWGSFEGWSNLIRQSIVWVGLPDPGLTRQELVEQSDVQAKALCDLLIGWDELDPDYQGLTTNEILRQLEQHPGRYQQFREAILELCPAPISKLPSVRSVGNMFRHLRGRVVGGRALTQRGKSHGSAKWVVHTAAGGSGESGESVSITVEDHEVNGTLLAAATMTRTDHLDHSDHPILVTNDCPF